MASFTAFGNLSTKVDTITVGDPITGGSIDQTVLTFTKLSGATTTVNLPTTGAVAGVSTINGVTGSTVNFASEFLTFAAAGGSSTDVNVTLTNGDRGLIRNINGRSFADFTIASKNSKLVITELTAAGSSDPNGIELEVAEEEPNPFVKVRLGTKAQAIADANANYIGVLPALTGDYAAGDDVLAALQVEMPAVEPANGTLIRYFVDGSASASTKKYRITNGTDVLAFMRNGEAYTFLFNVTNTVGKYLVIPGIITPQSKPDS
jgi:hypothetical protein